MIVRTVVVAHKDAMVAEGIAAALSTYPSIAPIAATTSAEDAVERGRRADAAALDETLAGADEAASRLRREGVRVVMIGEDEGGADEGVRVSPGASVSVLAAALVPGLGIRPPAGASLSHREREVLALAARGLAGKQIARCLGISAKTVEQHKTRIFSKLGVPNQTAAVSKAIAEDLTGGMTWSLSSI